MAARRTSACDINAPCVDHCRASTAGDGHRRLTHPAGLRSLSGVERVNRIHIGGLRIGLATKKIDHPIQRSGHAVVVGLRQGWPQSPGVGGYVIDLHGLDTDATVRIATQHINLVLARGQGEFGIWLKQGGFLPPLTRQGVRPLGQGRATAQQGAGQGGLDQALALGVCHGVPFVALDFFIESMGRLTSALQGQPIWPTNSSSALEPLRHKQHGQHHQEQAHRHGSLQKHHGAALAN